MKYRLILFLYTLTTGFAAFAQSMCEQIIAYTDKDCYLTGERICVRVDVTAGNNPSPSRVAYVEVADTHKMVTQCMVSLDEGQGWAELPIPNDIHSGTYQISVYTKALMNYGSETFYHSLVGIINGEKLSHQDNIAFLPYDSCHIGSTTVASQSIKKSYTPGEEIRLPLPEFDTMGCAVTVCGAGLASDLPVGEVSIPCNIPLLAFKTVPETGGHIVKSVSADGAGDDISYARLALVGKTASLCDGQRQADGSCLYYTSAVYGNLPVMVNAFDKSGSPVPMTLVSPYAAVLPKELPKLTVCCQEEALSRRAAEARKQAIVNQWLHSDTLRHSLSFLSVNPEYLYDLDEWTQMKDIRELFLEFVKGISVQEHHANTMLYTIDKDTKRRSKWPALVLLDGMPVYDVDEILNYDAHLIKYIQIYSGVFNFGSSFCGGVISFVTRGGRLSNYKLKTGEQLMSYSFPQNHPVFKNYTSTDCGTLLWMPAYKSKELSVLAPAASGVYQVIIQGKSVYGKTIRQRVTFEVIQ